jgi:hydrophobe/amphiphile efflux-1 (HAE1) family protein
MQWLARLSVKRSVFATVLMLVLLVLGAASYKSLGLDMFPNVDVPVVVITTIQTGAAAEEIESDITDKIEGAVNTISGIDNLSSTSSEGVSLVVVQFTLEKPVDVAIQEVRDKLSQVTPNLPKGIDLPTVSKIDPGASPVLFLALRSKQPIVTTTEIADKLVRRQIETIDGVGEVSLIGGRKRQINVILDPVRLRAQNLNALDVQRTLSTQNLNVPGGTVETGPGNITLRVAGRVTSLDELRKLVIREQSGHPIRLADVAAVEDGQEREESYAQFDDEPTVVLQIKKQSGKNTVAVVDTVLEKLDDVRKRLPPNVTLDIVYDNSSSIRTSTDAVVEHLVLGAVFAVIIVLMFLASGRSTVIAALAIPISIIGTFAVMYALGFTLNFLTLLALALAVGLVIDDAIVVIENIVSYIEKKGMKPFPAAIAATKDIGLAVLATTLALMAVFLPVSFMSGMVGRFLRSFGLTMAAAIGVSLFVSFTLTPMLGARFLKRPDENAPPDLLTRVVETFYRPIERGYGAALRFAMNHRWWVVFGCVAILMSTGPIAKHLTGGMMPTNDKGQFQISMRAPEGTSVGETSLIAERLVEDVRTLPGVTHALITVGDDAEKTANLATIRVILSDPKHRSVSQEDLMNRVRNEYVSKLPKTLRTTVLEISDIGTGSTANITYAVTGPDATTLERVAQDITTRLRKVPGATDVDNSLIVGKPEAKVNIDRDRAADLGVQVSDIASTLQLFVGGLKASTYPDGTEQYDIRVRGDERFRSSPSALSILTVPSAKYGSVPLDSVVTMVETTGPSTIKRVARSRQVTITANSAPGVGDTFVEEQLRAIGHELLPAGYQLVAQGRSKEAAKLVPQFVLAISLSVLFMYLVLAAQFESWLEPLCVMLVLPLTVPFAFLSLLILGQSINLFSLLGLLVLIGVVQKNAVLQVDHTKQLRAEGKSRLEAILEANRDRLRPILMTTLAFVAGMLPLVFSKGIGAGYNRAMSGIVVGGQTLSLLLTLLASPVIYSLLDDLVAFLKRKLPRQQTAEETGESELEAEEARA